LNAARVTFERLGATLRLERSARELTAIGEAVRPQVAQWSRRLTPRELQVALTIAEGATNKEAAAMLFLSPKTIEFHLGNVYRELGVGCRSQLTRLIWDVPSRAIVSVTQGGERL
jgi:DNA-binding NarL/FixJ family response regulator